jgi:RHS repeat-associated protein
VYLWDGIHLRALPLRPASTIILNGKRGTVWRLSTQDVAQATVVDGVLRQLVVSSPPTPTATPVVAAHALLQQAQIKALSQPASPHTTDTWTQTNGSFMGVYGLVIDPNNPNHLWIGSNFVLYEGYRANGQVAWTKRSGGGVWMGEDPVTTGKIYRSTPVGVDYSTDGGQTWTSGATTWPCGANVFLALSSTTVLAGAGGAFCAGDLYQSTNGGQSFNAVTGSLAGPVTGLTVDAINVTTVYAAVQGVGVEKSSDSGADWQVVSGPSLTDLGLSSMMSLQNNGQDEIFAGTEDGRVFLSTDGGVSWTSASNGLPQGAAVNALGHDPTTPSILYAGTTAGGGFYVSNNSGATWTWSGSGMGNNAPWQLRVGSDGTVWAGFNGLWMSTNHGATWTEVDQKAGELDDDLSAGPDGSLYIGAYPAGPWETDNQGQAWPIADQIGSSPGPIAGWGIAVPVRAAPSNPSQLYDIGGGQIPYSAGPTGSYTLFTSSNGGVAGHGVGGTTSWSQVSTPLPATPINDAADPLDPQTLWLATANGVWVTHSGGSSWSQAGLQGTQINAVVVAPTSPRTLYVTVPTGQSLAAGVYESTNAGSSWTYLTGTATTSSPVGLTLDATNPITPTLYVGTSQGELKSFDGGADWMVLSQGTNGLPSNWTFSSLAVDPAYPHLLLGANSGAVLRSTDGGLTWQNTDAPAAGTNEVVVDPSTGNVFYTDGTGAYQDVTDPLLASLQAPTSLTPDGRGGYAGNPFTITAALSDTSVLTQTNVQETLSLPPGLSFTQGVTTTTVTSQTQSLGNLASGGGPVTSFSVWAAASATTISLPYTLTVTSSQSGTQPSTVTGQIMLPGTAVGLTTSLSSTGNDVFPPGDLGVTLMGQVLGPPGDPTFATTPLTVTVGVYNASGSLVRTLEPGTSQPDKNWRWDGRDLSNNLLPPGSYEATLTATALVQGTLVTGASSQALTIDADQPTEACQIGVGGAGAHSQLNPLSVQASFDGVNTDSGNYHYSMQDLAALPGVGIPISFSRTYNSLCQTGSGPFGPGWTDTYYEHLILPSTPLGPVVHILDDGQEVYYTPLLDGNGNQKQDSGGRLLYTSPPGDSEPLVYDPHLEGGTGAYQVVYCDQGCNATFDRSTGNLLQLHDREGQITQLAYSADGTQEQIGDTRATTITLTLDPATGLVQKLVDPQGRTWRYSYSNGELASVSDPAQNVTQYSYEAVGGQSQSQAPARMQALPQVARTSMSKATAAPPAEPLQSPWSATRRALSGPRALSLGTALLGQAPTLVLTGVTDALSNTTSLAYDQYGRVTSSTDPQNNVTAFTYNAYVGWGHNSSSGNAIPTLVTTGGAGFHWDYYDANGRLRIEQDGDLITTDERVDAHYNAAGSWLQAPQGLVTSESNYDANGDVTGSVDAYGNASHSQYDDSSDLLTSTDAAGWTSTYQYDAAGDLLTSTDGLGNSTGATYDSLGNQTSSIDALGNTTTYGYDAQGNQISSTDPLQRSTTTTYNALGEPLVETDAAGHTTSYQYDSLGRTVAMTDADGNTTHYGYDALGHTIAVTDALGNVTHSAYDAAGELISETDALGNTTQYAYDALGHTIAVTDALGGVTHSVYDTGGRLTDQYDALGNHVLHNDYDNAGQLVDSVNAQGGTTYYAYDQDGRVVQETDPDGNTTTTTYDANGRVIAVKDGAGNSTQTAYDGDGRVLTSADALQYATTYGYDPAGQTVAVTDADGGVARSQYDAAGQLLTSTDPLGRQTLYGYDALGHTIAVTDAAGGVTHSVYDPAGRLLASTDPLGGSTSYGYDALGRQIAVTDADGGVTTSQYDAAGHLLASVDPLQHRTSYQYDKVGRQVAVTDPAGGVTSSQYDADGHLLTSTDALGNHTLYSYDAAGHVLVTTDALGGQTVNSYDQAGLLQWSTTPLSFGTNYWYDGDNRQIKRQDANGQIWHTVYDQDGRISQTSDPRNDTTSYQYDGLGHTITAMDAAGDVTHSGYDLDGELVTATDGMGNQTYYGYDPLGRQNAVTDALGHISHSLYDGDGHLISQTDNLGATTRYAYDSMGRTTRVTDADQGVTTSQYDLDGNLLTSTDALGNPTTYQYDVLGRQVAMIDALGGVTTSGYDALGRLLTSTDALQQRTTYQYDALGRQTMVTDADGHATSDQYDADGRLITVTDALGHQDIYGYDNLGHKTRWQDRNGNVSTYAYDTAGRLTGEWDQNNQYTGYTLDPLGRVIQTTDPTGRWTSSSYDADGRVWQTNDGNGDLTTTQYDALGRAIAVTDGAGRVTSSGYDADGHLMSSADGLGDTTTYGYDALGREITTADALGRTTHYGYDANGALTSVKDALGATTQYGYDALGHQVAITDANGRTSSKQYDLDGRLLASSDPLRRQTSYGYDAVGNTVVMTDGNGHVSSINYDAENRPLQTTYADGSFVQRSYSATGQVLSLNTQDTQVGYGYDPVGHTTVVTETVGGLGGPMLDVARPHSPLQAPRSNAVPLRGIARSIRGTTPTAVVGLAGTPALPATETSSTAIGSATETASTATSATGTLPSTPTTATSLPSTATSMAGPAADGTGTPSMSAITVPAPGSAGLPGTASAMGNGFSGPAGTVWLVPGVAQAPVHPAWSHFRSASVLAALAPAGQRAPHILPPAILPAPSAAGMVAVPDGAHVLPARQPMPDSAGSTATSTATPQPDDTATATASATATATPATPTPTSSGTPAQSRIVAFVATNTPTKTSTSTNTPTKTNTATNTATKTGTPTSTATKTNTPTVTRTATGTPTKTSTPTITKTPTNTRTATNTPTNTFTVTNTPTVTSTPTTIPPTSYSGKILADHPLAYWALDEGSGLTAHDLTGNGHTGALQNTVAFSSTAPVGMGGSAVFTSSGSGYIGVSTSSGLPSGSSPYSLEGWVQLIDNGNGGSGGQSIVAYGQYGAPNQMNALQTTSSTSLDNVWWGNDLGQSGLSDMRASWHYVAVTFDGSVRTLYQDGLAVAATSMGGANFQSSNLLLGSWGGNNFLNGLLAGVALYGYALTPSQVTAHYDAGLNLSPTPTPTVAAGSYAAAVLADTPVAFWPLSERSGGVAHDVTGHGHDGQIGNGVSLGQTGPPTGDGSTAMSFNGSSTGRIAVGKMSNLPSGSQPYSLEAWVDVASGGANAQGFVGYGLYGTQGAANAIRLNGANGLVNYWWYEDLGWTGQQALTGAWQHVVATFDGHVRKLYLDGQLVASDLPPTPIIGLATLTLGQTNGSEDLGGSLADVAVYGYALSPGQVAHHYFLGEGQPAPTPVTSVVQYSYDGAGRLTQVTYPDGTHERLGYDPAGRVNFYSLPDNTNNHPGYDGAGNETQLQLGSGGEQTWSYDAAGRLTGTTLQLGGSTAFSQTATLDNAGERIALSDSWGQTSYGYDQDGRLTSAGYPDGSSEADQYDAAGNRTVITATVGLSTTITANSYDQADELTGSVSSIGGSQPLTTTYTYDGNGNQIGSVGPTGTITDTYNLRNDLVGVQGPATNVSYVVDGEGDRLRVYDTSRLTSQLAALVQDIRPQAGLSSLLSDGTNDYGYQDFGSGAAPESAWSPAGSQVTYLTGDLLGSVRMASDQSQQVLGTGAYDAWGNAQPVLGSSGATFLSDLQTSQPFGYAGQYYDAGPGTYSMRAREYSPATGQFGSEDPQAYDPRVPVTLDPYEYAGDMPTDITDPSGQGWVPPDVHSLDYFYEQSIANQILQPSRPSSGMQSESDVPVYDAEPCGQHQIQKLFSANLVRISSTSTGSQEVLYGQVWDFEHVEALLGSPGPSAIANGIRTHLIANAALGGLDWGSGPSCNGAWYHNCSPRSPVTALLRPGTDFFAEYGIHGIVGRSGTKYLVVPLGSVLGDATILAWYGGPGLILYEVVPQQAPTCGLDLGCIAQTVIGNQIDTVLQDPNWIDKGLATAGIVALALDLLPMPVRLTAAGSRFLGVTGRALNLAVRRFVGVIKDCGCFPGDTGVMTPHGLVAIARLHVGDLLLAEDPATGKVEPAPLQAVIDDGIKPLMQVQMSDGTSLSVTTDHPFYVDSGPGITTPQWVQAGDLRVGDRLRTENGRDVTITALHYDTGYAHVYTLTVASDHDFFVGQADVLVHNANAPCAQLGGSYGQVRRAASEQGLGGQVHHIPPDSINPLKASPDSEDPCQSCPGIWMTTDDHLLTSSYGRPLSSPYMSRLSLQLDKDGYLAATEADIGDLRSIMLRVYGDAGRYDGALQRMLEYMRDGFGKAKLKRVGWQGTRAEWQAAVQAIIDKLPNLT